MAGILLAMLSSAAFGQAGDFDDWQGFEPGSWSEVRTIVETLDSQGTVVVSKSTSITRTKLSSAGQDSITLEVAKGSIEYAGKRFETPAATLVLRPYGRQENEKVSVADAGKVEIELAGAKFSCLSTKAQLTGENGNREVLTVFRDSATVHMPIRRVVTVFGADGKPDNTTTSEALALDENLTVSDKVVTTVHYRVLYRNHKVASNSLVDKSTSVPGQLVRATTAERKVNGTLQRVVTQELLDFHAVKEEIPSREIGDRPRRGDRRDDRRDDRRMRRSQ